MSCLSPFFLKLHRCSHIHSVEFSASFCRTKFLTSLIRSVSVTRLGSIHSDIEGLIYNISVIFYLFVIKCFLFLKTLSSFWKVFSSLSQCAFLFWCRMFPPVIKQLITCLILVSPNRNSYVGLFFCRLNYSCRFPLQHSEGVPIVCYRLR